MKRSFSFLPRRSRAPALPARARRLARLLLFLPLLCLLAATVWYCIPLARLLRANLPAVAAAETGRALHRQVRLAAVDFSPGAVTLRGVAISNRETWAKSKGEAAFAAPRVTVHYSLRALLFDSANAAHAFGDIDLTRPTVLAERLPDHSYNFSDLIESKKSTHNKPFVGQAIVHDATLHFRDYVAPARLHERPAYNTLYAVNAVANFHSERTVYFVGSGEGRSERLANVALQGDASRLTSGRFRVAAQVSDGDARYWADYFKAFPQARLLSGRASANVLLARLGSKPAPGLPLDLSGLVTFHAVSVHLTDRRLSHLPVQDVRGTATFTGSGVTAQATGLVGGQPVTASGTVFDFARPTLAFQARSSAVSVAHLVRYLPLVNVPPGLEVAPGPLDARITGASSDPVITFQAASPAVTMRNNSATHVHMDGLYAGNVLALRSVTFGVNGTGQGTARATVNFLAPTQPSVYVSGHVTGASLAALRLPPAARAVNLGGAADVSFLVRREGPLAPPSALLPFSFVANVTARAPRVRATTLALARGRVTYSPGAGLVISRALVQDNSGGVATVSGLVPTGTRTATGGPSQWHLVVSGAGLNLARLLSPYVKADMGGLAYAQAQISGPLARPQVTGTAQVYGGRFGRITTDAITGQFALLPDALRLQNVTLRRYPTEAHLSGTLTRLASGNPALSLDGALSQADVQDVLALAGQVTGKPLAPTSPALTDTLTGTAQGTFHVAGRLHAPEVTGHAAITDAIIDHYRINQLRADVAYRGDTVQVDNALLTAENGASATGHGHYALQTGRFAAALTGMDFPLDLLDPVTSRFVSLDGMANFQAALGGTAQSPTAQVSVDARAVTADGQSFAPFTLAGHYADGVFTQSGPPLTLAVTVPPVSLSTGEDAPATVTRYVLNSLRLSLPTPAHPKRVASLALTAAIPADAPEHLSHLLDTLRASRFAGMPAVQNILSRADALPAPPEATLAIPALMVTGPLSAPQASGTALITDASVYGARVKQATLTARYAGGSVPDAAGTLAAQNIVVSGVPIGTLTAQASLAGRVVTVSHLDARSQDAYLHAEGKANLDGALSATLDASNVPLALVNPFLPPARRLSGTVSALTVAASGLTRAPDLTASVNLDKPALEVSSPATPVAAGAPAALSAAPSDTARYALDSVRSGAITLTHPIVGAVPLLTVNDLSAYKGGHAIATLSGTLPLSLGAASLLPERLPSGEPLRADLRVADLSVLALFSPALIDPARTGGSLAASLSVTPSGPAGTSLAGTRQSGALLGQVTISNGSLGIVGFDTALQQINGRLALTGDRFSVLSLTAHSNRGGTLSVTGAGTTGAEGHAALRLTATDFQVNETGRQNFLARTYNSGVMGKVNGSVNVTGPWASPLAATALDAPLVVTDATATLPSAAAPSTAPKAVPAVNPRFALKVLLGGGRDGVVGVHSSLLKADARGDLELGGSLSDPTVRAHLSVVRGQFILPPSTLLKVVRSSSGEPNEVNVLFPAPDPTANNEPGLQTQVVLTAQANVSVSPAALAANQSATGSVSEIAPSQTDLSQTLPASTSALGGKTQRYTITARIHGLLNVPDKLTIDLQSSPPGLSRQQMLAALVPVGSLLGGGENALKQQLAEALQSVAVPALLSPLETQIAAALNLEDFSVNYAPDAPVVVTLTKDIAPRLSVTYIRLFGARAPGAVNSVLLPPEYTLKLSYGLTSRLQVSVSTDDQRNNTVALEGIYGF